MNDETTKPEETVEAPVEAEQETVEAAPAEAKASAAEEGTEEDGVNSIKEGLATGEAEGFKWYIAKTLTGQENKVQKALKERIVNFKLTEFFADILVPEERVTTNTNGRKRTVRKKFFPGYVLVRMIMNENTWHLVKDTDKITGFVGGTLDKPAPISEEEAAYMIGQIDGAVKKTRTTVDFTEGETVKVVEGPFASFVGTVEAVSDKGKVKVNVSIFGRPTPVELDFTQVEKVN